MGELQRKKLELGNDPSDPKPIKGMIKEKDN